MALFTRRALQRRINEANHFLTRDQVLHYVSGLNDSSKNILPLEWELAVLSGFARLGRVEHEANLGGETRPDVLFRLDGDSQAVAIDIVAVSDRGLHKGNPYEALIEELKKQALKLRQKGIHGGFFVDVKSTWAGVTSKREPVRLKLPPIQRFKDVIFGTEFRDFVVEILKLPTIGHTYSVDKENAELTITYTPRQSGISGMHVSYTIPRSKRRNPVANALRPKITQMKRSGFSGPLGIVICDGDCDMLHGSSYGTWFGDSYSVEEVVSDFFRQNSSLSFVLVLSVRLRSLEAMSVGPGNLEFHARILTNVRARKQISPSVANCLKKLPSVLPRPMRTPQNVRYHLDWLRKTQSWFDGESLEGGVSMSDRTVKLSARSILDLLAGQSSQERFLRIHRFGDDNPFQIMRKQGRLITNVRVEKSEIPEDDDERLVFEFGDPDPAITPFREPDSK